MRKSFLFIFSLLSIGLCTGQVGVNTRNPQGAFHIDSRSNTTGTPAAPVNDLDDVIVANDGKVGIGTMAPSTLLDIRTGGTPSSPIPGFQLQDGNEAAGSLFSVNNAGFATWQNFTPLVAAQIVRPSVVGVDVGFNDPNYYNSTAYIVLPPGRWALNTVSLIYGNSGTQTPVWLSSTLADAVTVVNSGGAFAAVKSPDIEGAGVVAGLCWAHTFYTVTGTLVVNNTSSVNKTYYYAVGGTSSFGIPASGFFERIGAPTWGETNIIAYRIPSNI